MNKWMECDSLNFQRNRFSSISFLLGMTMSPTNGEWLILRRWYWWTASRQNLSDRGINGNSPSIGGWNGWWNALKNLETWNMWTSRGLGPKNVVASPIWGGSMLDVRRQSDRHEGITVIVSGDISDPKSLELDGLWSPTSKVNFESFSPLTSPRIPGSSVNPYAHPAHRPHIGRVQVHPAEHHRPRWKLQGSGKLSLAHSQRFWQPTRSCCLFGYFGSMLGTFCEAFF